MKNSFRALIAVVAVVAGLVIVVSVFRATGSGLAMPTSGSTPSPAVSEAPTGPTVPSLAPVVPAPRAAQPTQPAAPVAQDRFVYPTGYGDEVPSWLTDGSANDRVIGGVGSRDTNYPAGTPQGGYASSDADGNCENGDPAPYQVLTSSGRDFVVMAPCLSIAEERADGRAGDREIVIDVFGI